MGVLTPGTNVTCGNECLDIGGQPGPPEPSPNEFFCPRSTWVTRELNSVPPLEDISTDRVWDKQAT